jgi:two-component system, OmpR family, phosphate regulon sensor histidine kinase PhoR
VSTATRQPDLGLLGSAFARLPFGLAVVDARTGELVVANDEIRLLRDSGELQPLLAGVFERGETVTDEVIGVVRDDGSSARLSISAGPAVDATGRIAACICLVHDVTDRELRERAQRDFVTNAAHELQTPLTAIMAATEVLQSGAKDVPGERDRFLGHIEAECERLGRLVRALLVLARAQVAGETAPQTPVPLRPLLDDVALALRPAKGIEVRVSCPEGLAALGTPELLSQALANLGANAAKHTGSGWIRLGATRRNGRVAIEVADTGPGLPPGVEERVFERFFRGGRRDREGFGLGLAIVHEAVAAMGGTVRIRSPRRGGTVATIELPAP